MICLLLTKIELYIGGNIATISQEANNRLSSFRTMAPGESEYTGIGRITFPDLL